MSGVTYALTTVVLHRSYSRYSGSTCVRRGHLPAGGPQAFRHQLLVRRVRVRVEQTHRDDVRLSRSEIVREAIDVRLVDGHEHRAGRVEPLVDAKRQAIVHDGPRGGDKNVVEGRPRLTTDADDVFETRGDDECDTGAAPLEHRVGRDSRAVHDLESRRACGQVRDAVEDRT